jgi:hypothetical protein
VATAWAILTETSYGLAYYEFGRRYPDLWWHEREVS